MPRLPRLHVPGGFYHVTARGNHRQDIFFEHADRQLLDTIMADALLRTGARIHAYCWMTNHLHLLVQVADQPLGNLMQRVATRFARAIQRNLDTTGHLFENRYHALLVDADSYFLELLRYIHLNPVHGHLVAMPHQYRWSSHRTYLGLADQRWISTDFGLSLFSAEVSRARQLYRAFIEERNTPPIEPTREIHPRERRVMGCDAFLAKLAVPSHRRKTAEALEQVALDICNEFGASLAQLRAPGHTRRLNRARAEIAALAVSSQIATLSEVARYLHRSASSISRAMVRYGQETRQSANVQT